MRRARGILPRRGREERGQRCLWRRLGPRDESESERARPRARSGGEASHSTLIARAIHAHR
eukprot:scaffold281046_cov21-Tisochrysis_lutea.AAC.1